MKPIRGRRPRGGFTLIEVLLVLVILVVLASLAVVAYGPIQKRAYINAARVQIDAFATALNTYQLSVGDYPSALQALRERPADLQNPDKWDGPYLGKDVPLDPWNKPYEYVHPGQHNPDSFDVWTVAPDGQAIGNWSEEIKR